MLTATDFAALHAAGCIQTGADHEPNMRAAIATHGVMFLALLDATHNDPCDGCPAYNGGKCEAFRRYNTRAQRPVPTYRPAYRPKSHDTGGRCPDCGLRVRGKNHAEGKHHKERTKGT